MLALADGEIRLRGEQGANKGAVSPGKTWALLALADGETKLSEERGANIGVVSPGKSGPCWRWRTEKQGFARGEAPT